MHIKVGFEIEFVFPEPTPLLLLMHLHPTRDPTVWEPEQLLIEPPCQIHTFVDGYGNRCSRATVSAGACIFRNQAVVLDSGLTDLQAPHAKQATIQGLPDAVLPYLLPSRYCEVDSELREVAWTLFKSTSLGWQRVQAICEFVHQHIQFDYLQARPTRTALEAYRERVGVCRDYTHLAITLCRCLNIPARYCTGYLGDIGIPAQNSPMDFSAWLEVYLDDQWYAFDARNLIPRTGRVLMARGRDATDVALMTCFGMSELKRFEIFTSVVGSP